MELSEARDRFDALDINVVAISYDSVEANSLFASEFEITFPLLSDSNAVHAIAFGILNESYRPGHGAYGVPHPGIFLVNSAGIVVEKFAEKNYRERPSLKLVLEAAAKMAAEDETEDSLLN